MATPSSSTPEEARPPESQYRKLQYRKNGDLNTNYSACQNVTVHHTDSLVPRITRISGLRNVLFHKRKISCITSTDSERSLTELTDSSKPISVIQVPKDSHLKSVVAPSNSLPPNSSEEVRPKTRHSVHLDVDEALSSLLWQPYEYQNANNNQDRYSLSSYDDSNCSCSSGSGGSSRSDLADKFGTTAFCYGTNNGSMAAAGDPHYLTKTSNNNNGNSIYCHSNRRRRRTVGGALEGGGGSNDGVALNVAYLTRAVEVRDSLSSYASVSAHNSTAFVATPTVTNSLCHPIVGYTHGTNPNGGTMRAELPQAALVPQLLPTLPPRPNNNNSVEITTNNVSNMVLSPGSTGNSNPSTAASSLHTANVVGLPQHCRQSSIPSSTCTNSRGGSVIFPIPSHPRTASEPIQQRYHHPSTPSVVVPLQRQHVDNHLRAATTRNWQHQHVFNQPLNLMKSDFNTPQQRAPLVHDGTTTTEHFNIVHRMAPIDQQQNKPQLSVTHQRIPSDFNFRGEDDASSCSTAVPSQLHITHQRTVSDIAQSSSTVRNDTTRTVATAMDINSRMVPEMITATNGNVCIHQRSSSIPNNSKNTAGVLNVSNVNVNYYRAVPVNVVSAVPTIHCVNTTNESLQSHNVNISNVNIIQAMSSNNTSNLNKSQSTSHSVSTTTLNSNDNNNATCTEVIVHSTQDPMSAPQPPVAPSRLLPLVGTNATRTFTSTEAQTDEIVATTDINAITTSIQQTVPDPAKEHRRRERRERKHQRRLNNVNHRHNTGTEQNPPAPPNNRLPDILNSHLPPPYSGTTAPTHPALLVPPIGFHSHHHLHGVLPPHHQGLVPTHSASGVVVPHGGPMVPGVAYHGPVLPQGTGGGGQVPLVAAGSTVHHPQAVPVVPVVPSSGFRFPFPTTGFRRSRYSDDHPPKGCCGLLSWKPGSLRWFIALIALVAVCCVLVGTALGAMRPAGRDHLTVSLLMIARCYVFTTTMIVFVSCATSQIGIIRSSKCLLGNYLNIYQPPHPLVRYAIRITYTGQCTTTIFLSVVIFYQAYKQMKTFFSAQGVGIVLVTVSAIAWRLTSHSPTTGCRSILGLGPATSTESIDNAICTTSSRRFVPRLPPAYGGGRPHHPYAAMLYPEFQYRPPPPTYQASMQEYRLRLLLLDRVGGAGAGIIGSGAVVASPPPTYRSGYGGGGGMGGSSVSGSLLRSTLSHRRALHGGIITHNPPSIIDTVPIHGSTHSDYSPVASLAGPPSYRSAHTSLAGAATVTRPVGTLQQQQQHIVLHSRDHSLTLSESVIGSTVGRNGGVNVVSILNGGGDGDGGGVRLVMNGEGGFEVVGVGELEGCGVDDIKLDGGPLDTTITDLVEVVTGSSKTEDPDNQTSSANHIKDGNLVTIVQTGDDQSPVIVTVSGGAMHHHTGALCTNSCVLDNIGRGQMGLYRHHHQLVNGTGAIDAPMQMSEMGGGEMEILAHL